MAIKRFVFLVFILTSIFFTVSCKKAIKKRVVRSVASTTAKKIIAPIFVSAGVYLVSKEYLANSFDDMNQPKEPIQATFINNNKPNINLRISLNGKEWRNENVPLGEKLEVDSDLSGIIGIESDEFNAFQIDETNTFTVKEVDGKIDLYSN